MCFSNVVWQEFPPKNRLYVVMFSRKQYKYTHVLFTIAQIVCVHSKLSLQCCRCHVHPYFACRMEANEMFIKIGEGDIVL